MKEAADLEKTVLDLPPVDLADERAVRERLSVSRVAIVGCGGLGSNIAMMLVRSGIGSLVLCDGDAVEESNLNRQNFFREDLDRNKAHATSDRLKTIRPDVEIVVIQEYIAIENCLELAKRSDVVVEAVDSAEFKEKLLELTDLRDDAPLVMGFGLAGAGDANEIRTHTLSPNLFIAGDMESDIRDDPLLLASRVMLVAAHQAHATIRLLLGHAPA